MDENSEYIGRATMDNLEYILNNLVPSDEVPQPFPRMNNLFKYATQKQYIVEQNKRDI
jgi:hypothetical protein